MVTQNIELNRINWPYLALGVGGGMIAYGLFGPNEALTFLAIAVLFLGGWWLWRPGESPILLVVFGFQWVQASLKAFQGNWMGTNIVELAFLGGDIYSAVLLSLVALGFLALGMRLGARSWHPVHSILIRNSALQHEPRYWFRIYIVAFLVATVAQSLAWVIPGLTQPLLALASLKWAFFWLLAYATFVQSGSGRQYFLGAFLLEMLWGLGGYFSDFKTPLMFTFFAVVAAGVRLSIGRQLALLLLVTVTLIMGVTWTAVKDDYRRFVSGNENNQAVVVGYSERMLKLADLVDHLDADKMVVGAEQFLMRLAYVDFFGVVLEVVPNTLPYEGGAIWWDAISRPFMPRLFFPEKTSIDDSERTSYYTRLRLIGTDVGTSISIGYMGESYIDFGRNGMMAPIFAFGFLLGSFYRWMLRLDPGRRLLGMALATATIFPASFLDTSITKIFGGLIVAMFVSWVILRFVAPRYFPEDRMLVDAPVTRQSALHPRRVVHR